MAVLKRGGEVRTHVIADRTAEILDLVVKANVHRGSELYTDENSGYFGLGKDYAYNVIDHAVSYVDGQIYAKGLENFWSLVKRGLGGTYVSVEPFHLFRYLDEQGIRYNIRKDGDRGITDAERFQIAMGQISGKRLTYEKLTGKEGETEAF